MGDRNEIYLRKIAGEDIDISNMPEPSDRIEGYLKTIAENGGGSVDPEDIAEIVTDWLDDHVDPETGYVLDDTLSIAGAAADAKAAGDAVDELKSATGQQVGEWGGNVLPIIGSVPGYISATGSIYSAGTTTKERTWNFVKVVPGQKIKCTWRVKGDPWSAFGYWGADKTTFISRIGNNTGTHEGDYYYNTQEVTVPANAYYFRFSMRTYDDYTASVQIATDILVKQEADEYGNLYVENTSVAGYVSATGTISSPSAAKERTSDYIPVSAGEVITIQNWATVGSSEKLWIAVGIYDISKTFITRSGEEYVAGTTYAKKLITVPVDGAYIRVSARMYSDGRLSVTKGDYALPYRKSTEDYADKQTVNPLVSAVKATQGLFNPLLRTASPKLAAHRGAMSEAPENTLPAFEIAGQYAGIWAIETDVCETSDGYFICSHDNDVSRMTDGTGNITSMTYAQTQECTIDAGANVDQYPDLKMPLFSDYLKVCRRYGKVAFPEMKSITHFDNFIAEIRKAGMEGSCILQMYYNLTSLDTLRQMTGMPIQILTMSNTLPVSDLIALAKQYDDVWVSIPDTSVTEANLQSAHTNNLPVAAWTYTAKQDIIDDVKLGLDIAIAQGVQDLE